MNGATKLGRPRPVDGSRPRMPRLRCLMLPVLFVVGCGEATSDDEARAMQAADVAGSTLLALSSASQLGVDSAAAQDASDTPEPPDTAQGPCVTFTIGLDLSLLVDHGTGCQVGASFVSGAYVLRLLARQQLGLEIEFQRFEVDDLGLDGKVSVGIGNGRINAAMDLDVTDRDAIQQLDFTGSLWGQPSQLLIDGAGAYDVGDSRWAFDATSIRLPLGACYPDDGVFTVETPAEDRPITFFFTRETPTTGLMPVRIGEMALDPVALPAVGDCPP